MLNLKIGGIAAGLSFTLSFFIGLVSGNSMPALILRPLIFGVVFFIAACFINLLVSRFLPELLDGGSPGGEDRIFPGSKIDITLDDTGDAVDSPRKPSGTYQDGISGPAMSAVSGAAMPSGEDDPDGDLGNISDLMNKGSGVRASGSAAGMDQDAGDGYTNTKRLDNDALSGAGSGAESGIEAGRPGRDRAFTGAGSGAENGASFAGVSPGTSGKQAAEFSSEAPDPPVDLLPDLESMAGAFLPSAAPEDADTVEYSVSQAPRKPLSNKKSPAWAGDFNAKDMAAGLRTVLSKEKEG